MTEPQPPPPDRVGTIGGLVKIVQSITLSQALIIALLLALALPSFVIWRAMNDASLLNKFMSYYEELPAAGTSCTLRVASQRGADPVYSISTGIAFQGADRYSIAVLLTHKPDDKDALAYCATLGLIVDFLRRPEEAPKPPMIWPYREPEGSP